MFSIELYETETGRSPVKDYLGDLAKSGNRKGITQIKVYADRLRQYGPGVDEVYPETIRKLNDTIYELRPGKHRVFFFFFIENRIVLLHAYRKHRQKTPPGEIRTAEQERKDYIRRNEYERKKSGSSV